ncbi:MAG: hypothetical protein VR71_03815 [Roseovarius sp. BRH_c41]|uniref:hypothetical protein n=1 Tax=Roseovarius sp. BRH_c41 TaxID=1629709 RepID=UPI0005F27332|nr:hypothetical protein [Roseovarius sp. BRH_c41]KJS44977.1 MAG: hypothetical protein VR71_03815 [Roseovarius sp. BRH_c41]
MTQEDRAQKDTKALTRRRLLTRLGLATGLAYVAPVMMHLGAAHASGASGRGSRGSRGSGASGRGYYRNGYYRNGYYYERGSSGGSYGSGPSGRGRRGRLSTGQVVDQIIGTLDGLGALR